MMTETLSECFRRNIKRLRKEQNLTQKGVAIMIGTTQQGYSKWEKGVTAPTLGLIERVAEVFGVEAVDLLK